MSIQIITDSAADLALEDRENVTVLPMAVTFGETQFLDGVNLDHRKFYELLIETETLPTTSQITPFRFEEAFREAVDGGNTVIVVTIASKLSGTYQGACIAARDFPGKVWVVDSENATIGEGILVKRAVQLVKQGLKEEEIAERLNFEKKDIRLIALLDTLEYLKRGGRISKSVAMIGGMLSIKPVVIVEDGEVKLLGKARGSKNGNNLLIKEIEKGRGIDFTRPYALGYTGLSDELLQKYISDSSSLWENHVDDLPVRTVGGTVGTHVGPGAVAVAFFSLSGKERT